MASLARVARGTARRVIQRTPLSARDELKKALIHGHQAIRNILYRAPAAPIGLGTGPTPVDFSLVVHPTKDDVLFIGGLGWDVVNCSALSKIKASTGFKIASIIYDLIPINHPEFLGGQPGDYFLNYFIHMADLNDHSFCISKCTQRDFTKFCSDEGRIPPPTSVLYLGANVPAEANPNEITDSEMRERLSRGRYALTVGTFEVRKNYKLLLAMWHELINDPLFDLDLVIVGMPGWRVDNIILEMEKSPLYGKRIFWFKSMSDAGLSWLYENCQVFLFPSLYEGWGLPVVEALQHGRPAIISSRGATPEAGMGIATVIDPDRPDEWMRHIKRYATMGRSESINNVDLHTWDDAARHVKVTLASLFRSEIV